MGTFCDSWVMVSLLGRVCPFPMSASPPSSLPCTQLAPFTCIVYLIPQALGFVDHDFVRNCDIGRSSSVLEFQVIHWGEEWEALPSSIQSASYSILTQIQRMVFIFPSIPELRQCFLVYIFAKEAFIVKVGKQ